MANIAPEHVLRATLTVYVDNETKYREGIAALDALLARLSAAEQERDEEHREKMNYMGWYYDQVALTRAAEARAEAAEQALREIAKRGVKFDARGTHSREVCDIARAALAGREERE